MPRIVVAWIALTSGCFFDANYSGTVRCSDGQCPSGLTCFQERCVSMVPIDMMPDVPIDAPPAALTCADPGPFPSAGGTTMGTTVGATSKMSSSCGGFVMNGPDRVYQITMNGTQSLRVAIAGGRKAYVTAMPCLPAPNTPPCLGNAFATEGNPVVVTPAVGPAFVVVDDENATATGTYTLTLTIP